jgi:hypothetical protein
MRLNIPGTSPYEPVIGFSGGVRAGQEVYVAGTGPVSADLADAATQTRHVEDWEDVGKAHGEFFGTIRPAATMVVVAGLLQPTCAWRLRRMEWFIPRRATKGDKWQAHWGLREAVWQSYRFAI